jgi:RNA polymerase sigma factor (sigma-70 family)
MESVRRRSANESDRQLLRASRDGAGGFDAFYRRHREVVLAYLAQRVREPELAADLTAETFAAALAAVHDRGRVLPDTPLAWLFAIAHRKLVDSYRRGQVEDDARRRLSLESIELEDADLERIAEIANDVDVMERLASQLPSAQFDALQARVVDEREYVDIARELECSEAVVRMRVSRALSTLRAASEGRHE